MDYGQTSEEVHLDRLGSPIWDPNLSVRGTGS